MKGIVFIPEMARALCAGRKMQTRRLLNPQPTEDWTLCQNIPLDALGFTFKRDSMDYRRVKPAHRVGERVCLLTTWAYPMSYDKMKPSALSAHERFLWHAGLGDKGMMDGLALGKSRPGSFLPNHLRPLMPLLEITDVRCQRVQDISEEDAKAQGISNWKEPDGRSALRAFEPRPMFQRLWDSIHAKDGHGWQSNPWVFAYSFRRVAT